MINEKTLKEHLKEGIYHEIGHIIATLLCFPGDDRLKCMQMHLKPNGSYGIAAVWKEDIKFNYHTQLDAFTNVSFAGGIFQQMMGCYKALKNQGQCFSFKEKLISLINPQKSLYLYFKRNIKPMISGMEVDMNTVLSVYDELKASYQIKSGLDQEKVKCDVIKLLLPFVDKKEIENLCEHCLNVFWEGGQNRQQVIEVDNKTLKEMLYPTLSSK